MRTFNDVVVAMTEACGVPDDVRPTVVRWFVDPTETWPIGVSVSLEGECVWVTVAGGTDAADDLRVSSPEGGYVPLCDLDDAVNEAAGYLRACRPVTGREGT